jgi:hypothetical protein
MESNYSKLFAGSFIVAQRIAQNLREQGISPIIKDALSHQLTDFKSYMYILLKK